MTEAEMNMIVPGAVLKIHEKIEDVNGKGEKRERIQLFEGLVLGVRGSGSSKTFTIRKETDGFGVEKIFPVSSPNLVKVEGLKVYKVRRAKLQFTKDFDRKFKEVKKEKVAAK